MHRIYHFHSLVLVAEGVGTRNLRTFVAIFSDSLVGDVNAQYHPTLGLLANS